MQETTSAGTKIAPRYDITIYGVFFYCIMALIVNSVFTRFGPLSLQLDAFYSSGVLTFIEFTQIIFVSSIAGLFVGEFVRRSCLKEGKVTMIQVFNKFIASFPIVIVLVVMVMWNVHG